MVAVDLPGPVAAFLAAYDAQDTGAVRACCAPDVHYEDPLTPAPLEGVDALTDHLRAAWAAFPDGRLEPTGAVPRTGAVLAAPCKLVATHRGPVGPLPATGRFLVAHALLYAELDADGTRLWRVRAFYDAYGAATQLGALPRPGTAGQRALMVLQGFGAARRRL
ncbi:MAG: hypothetical protein JWM31_3590 [Solirubrobacterales bacterium]|nr:hypothetical protein [Solirubrobacterales bacterium]